MIKINIPTRSFKSQALIRYKGTNQIFFQNKSFEKMNIIEIDYNLHESLLIKNTMYDGTELMFSMISSNLFIKENDYYELKDGQNFCDFELFTDKSTMIFEGYISYENQIALGFIYKEFFELTIILPHNDYLYDIWVKHNKRIN